MLPIAIAAGARAEPVDAWLDAVVLVQQGSTTCAGALVSDGGQVATAYHCVAAGGRPRVTLRGGARATGRVVATDVAADLAVIEVPELAGRAWLAVADAPPAPGAPVWALGHPLGKDVPTGFLQGTLRWSSAAGAVSAVGPAALQVSAPLNPGNSGGPVVDAEGRVVGVASRRLSGDGLGFAARADRLPALLSGGRRGLSPLGGTLAVEVFLASQDGPAGSLAAGARAEVAVRDRLVLDAAGLVPLSPRWSAARFDRAKSGLAEARGGLRQRLGIGAWAVRLDGWAGVTALQTVESAPDDPLDLETTVAPTWLAGGTIRLRQVGFEVGWLPDAELVRTSIVLRWPGVVAVY